MATLTPFTDNQDTSQYNTELRGAINTQAQVIPEAMNLERGMMPGLQQYQSETMGSQSQNLLGQYGAMQQGALQGQFGYQNQLMGGYGAGGGYATDASIQNLGYGGMQNYNAFQQQAYNGMQLGSQLSDQEIMGSQQASRAAMAARGLTGNQAIGQEVLGQYQLGNQRLQQRMGYGQQAYQMASGQQQFGQQAYLNPAIQQSQAIYGLGQLYGATQQSFQNMGPQFLQPESQYLANIRSNRIQQQNANSAANAQQNAGIAGGIGALGAAAIMAFCWVAREVYGTESGEWLLFREWMLNEAPSWLRAIYIERGEDFAKFISNKPILKRIVKSAMDLVVQKRKNLIKFYA